ncbi:TraR/DksA family transcriptional regulator [Patescibacteria group bacterium]
MNKKVLAEIKEKLENEETLLKDQISKVIKPKGKPGGESVDAKFPQYGTKEDDNAAEVAAFQDNLSLESDLERNLHDVQNAIGKIKSAKYGICENCGNKISDRRLEAYPTARKCLKCTATNKK